MTMPTDQLSPTSADAALVLYACRDLLFTSKITATARAHGTRTEALSPRDDLAAALSRPETRNATAFLVDLDLGDDGLALIRSARAAAPDLRIIAFGSHVDRDRLTAALTSGANEAVPRSRFVSEMGRYVRPHD